MTLDVERARQLTPGCRHVTHLNNAGAALMPQPVLDALHGHIDREATMGGYEAATAATEQIDATYASIARLLGATADEIAFVDSATRAWHMAFHSVPLRAGQRILTTSAEYSSNAMSLGQAARRVGAEVVLLPDDRGEDRLRHQRGAGVVEVDHLARAGRLRAQPLHVERRRHGLSPSLEQPASLCVNLTHLTVVTPAVIPAGP